MPFIQVTLAAAPHPELTRRVASAIGSLTQKHLHKDPAVTAIAVQYVPPQQWFVAGTALSERGQAAFWLDIKITDATNTKAEMAAYIAAVFSEMAVLLGPLHEESYVLVDAVPAHAYGYGGRTQEHRYVAAHLSASR
jgi:4-oxalocrotonate tautomerase